MNERAGSSGFKSGWTLPEEEEEEEEGEEGE